MCGLVNGYILITGLSKNIVNSQDVRVILVHQLTSFLLNDSVIFIYIFNVYLCFSAHDFITR